MNSAVDKRWLAKDRYSVWPEPGSLLGRKLTAANVTSSHTNLTPARNTNLTLILDRSSFVYVTQILHHKSYTDLRKPFIWLRLPQSQKPICSLHWMTKPKFSSWPIMRLLFRTKIVETETGSFLDQNFHDWYQHSQNERNGVDNETSHSGQADHKSYNKSIEIFFSYHHLKSQKSNTTFVQISQKSLPTVNANFGYTAYYLQYCSVKPLPILVSSCLNLGFPSPVKCSFILVSLGEFQQSDCDDGGLAGGEGGYPPPAGSHCQRKMWNQKFKTRKSKVEKK